jgi:hypothetical protein
MGRLGALLKVMLAFVGFVAVPVEAAARRHRLQLVEDSIRQSVFGGTLIAHLINLSPVFAPDLSGAEPTLTRQTSSATGIRPDPLWKIFSRPVNSDSSNHYAVRLVIHAGARNWNDMK